MTRDVTRDLHVGVIAVPDGFDVEVDAVIRARPAPFLAQAPMLAGRPGTLKDAPAPTLVISRRPSAGSADDDAALLRMFLTKTAAATTGMRVTDRTPIEFGDGARGACVGVTLDTTPAVAQVHVVRTDAGTVTHMVLAAGVGDDDGMRALVELAAGWRPT